MSKKVFIVFAILAMLFALPVFAQGYKGYPNMCTDNTSVSNPGSSHFISCDQANAGTTSSTPSYFRLVDQNTTLTMDVERLSAIRAGFNGTYNAGMTAAVIAGVDPTAGNNFYIPWTDIPNDAMASATMRGLITGSMNLFYNTSGVGNPWSRWHGGNANADNMAAATIMPYMLNFNMSYDTVGGNWDRTSRHAAGDALGATQSGVDSIAYMHYYDATTFRRFLGGALADNMAAAPNIAWVGSHTLFYDGTNFRRWLGGQINSDAVAVTNVVPKVNNFGMFYDQDDTDWQRDTGADPDGDDVPNTQTAPFRLTLGYMWQGDAALWFRLNGVAGSAVDMDGANIPGLKTDSVLYVEDGGGNFDPVGMGTTQGSIMVEEQDWPSSFNETDSTNDTQKMYSNGYLPAEEGPTAVDDAGGGEVGDVVLTNKEVIEYPNWTVCVKNEGGGSGDALADAIVLVSPTGNTGEWESLTWTTCDTLASGGGVCCYRASTQSDRYVRVEALCGGGDDTTVSAWLTANPN